MLIRNSGQLRIQNDVMVWGINLQWRYFDHDILLLLMPRLYFITGENYNEPLTSNKGDNL